MTQEIDDLPDILDEEKESIIRSEAIAAFINFCEEEEGIEMPDHLFESFLGA